MSDEYKQIPESFISDLEDKRRRLVEAQEENGVNLDALVDFLYPDTAHLVFELLQNAEDAGAKSARFKLSGSRLSFTHDGRPFTEEDLDSITNYFKSAKYETEDTIGRFGIGFKSVFGCTETPRIYSDTVAFEIVDRIVPRAIPRPASSVRLSNRETVFELPFNGHMKPKDEVREEIRRGLAEMSSMSVLHLQSITSIEWRTDDGNSGWIKRSELDDGVVRVDAKRNSGQDRRYFLRFREPYAEGSSMHLAVVFELREKDREQVTLDVGRTALSDRFRIVPAERGRVAVFFPAEKETSNLRFHLHAPFIPELSRASIKDHAENKTLFGRLAELVAESLTTIRDLGFLDREFLGVLPNSRDRLPEAYSPFHEAVIEALREAPLVPIQGGGHGRVAHLLQGPADFKDFLGVDDIHFLMSGWDSPYKWGPRVNRRTEPTSNYQGWAVAATQQYNEVDRLLRDLEIDEFKIEYLRPPASKDHREIEDWLAMHDVAWHRAYYASVERHWVASGSAYSSLRKLPIVRTKSGKFRLAAECRFATDGDDAPEGVTLADPETYSGGKGAKAARKALERLGVCEIDEESKAIGILEKYYGESGHRPTWDEHRRHVESFIGLVQEGLIAADRFGEYNLLLDRGEDGLPATQLYAGHDYPTSSAAPYYQCLERVVGFSERYEIDPRYRNIPGFDEFARSIGVTYAIPIEPTICESNPKWEHLRSGGGVNFTPYGTDRDWHVRNLAVVLERLQEADHAEDERKNLARAIQIALDEAKEHTWPPPPPEHCGWEGAVSGWLVAVYRRNTHAEFRTAPSQLVSFLRTYAWVPQQQGRDNLAFVAPSKARPEWLPEGFAFDSGWTWMKAIGFGSESGEAESKVVGSGFDGEAQEAKAKELGFESLEAFEDGRWFAGLSDGVKKEIKKQQELERRRPPEFFEPPNPERRREKAKELAKDAPRRETKQVERRVVEGEPKLKEDARTKLRAKYEEHAHVSLCQVVGCRDRSFKMKDGAWYFEAVRFLRLRKMVADDYVALCPRHAAMYMYQYANESDGLKQEFEEISSAGNHGNGMRIPVELVGEKVDVLLAPEHVIDLGAALEVDAEQDAEGD